MSAKKTAAKTLRVTQLRSVIGCPADQKATVKALGLKRINDTIDKTDSPAVRGMLFKVKHLVKVEEL
ncbi:MAG: 50S ribosomal protein L30 [Coriobacteriales bacterium]|nr:50S ribosomal protein L30 [Coriobacteriales bacterium]